MTPGAPRSDSRSSTLTERAALDQPWFYDTDLDHIYDVFAQMRREEPVFWYEPGRFWVLSKYEDQRHVGSHPELFSSRYGFLIGDNFDPSGVVAQLPGWAQDTLASCPMTRQETRGYISRATLSLGDPDLLNLGCMDPPEHSHVRNILTNAFNMRDVRELRRMIEGIANATLDAIEPGSTLDFVETVAARIPSMLVSELVGVPAADRERFVSWAVAFVESATLTPETDPERVERIVRWAAEFVEYLKELLERRRTNPGDDVLSRIVGSELDGEPVSQSTALMLSVIFIVGVSNTSSKLIGLTAQALAERPDQRAILLKHPEFVDTAVDEVLRWYPIIWTQCRTALERTEIRGRTIEEGAYLVLPFPSANRDEEIWEHPDRFDVTRAIGTVRRHLGFGWGAHRCPGAALARLEGRVFLEAMLARFPSWELAGEPVRHRNSMMVNGLQSMPVRFEV
jgi:cytochrome P450